MNYIHRLLKERDEARQEIEVFKQTIHEVRSYLNSDKFKVDTTVQVNDVLTRLADGEAFYRRLFDGEEV